MNLSDFFSDDFRQKFAENKVNLGTTLLIEIPNFNLDYKKFAIIIGLDSPIVALVVINSEINPNIFTSPFLRSQHILIPVIGHETFLVRDSYIDCTIFQYKDQEEIIKFINENPDKVYNVSEDICRKINLMISTSNLISSAQKKRFGF